MKTELANLSEWFDEQLRDQVSYAWLSLEFLGLIVQCRTQAGVAAAELRQAMVLLLARAYDYALRTDDLLELAGSR